MRIQKSPLRVCLALHGKQDMIIIIIIIKMGGGGLVRYSTWSFAVLGRAKY